MYRRPPVSTRTAPLFPPPTLFRSVGTACAASGEAPADAAAAALTHQPAGIEAAGDAAGGIALADAAAAVLQTHQPAGSEAAGDAAGGIALADAADGLQTHQPADKAVTADAAGGVALADAAAIPIPH